MRYCVADIHGKYELFAKLLKRISFSDEDVMYVCGDIIDKGEAPVKLARLISSYGNIRCIVGNHEYAFLKYYHSMLESSPDNFDSVLAKLREYFQNDGDLLDWELVDWLDSLPNYIEEDEFVCVHAGAPIDSEKRLLPLSEASVEQLVYDRRFKEPSVVHFSPKCVFYGHTETSCLCGENKILGYKRSGSVSGKSIKDYYKIHLDTGAWHSGVLGCFCIDTAKAIYVKE